MSLLDARLSFLSPEIARIEARAEDLIYFSGLGLSACFFLMGIVAIAGQKSTGWTLLSVLSFVLVPVIYMWFDKISEKGNRLIFIDKAQKRIRQVTKESSRMCSAGHFRELHIYEVNPPGKGSRVYQVHLFCTAGSTVLFALFSEDRATQLANEVANWLVIPVSFSRNASLGTVLENETLFLN